MKNKVRKFLGASGYSDCQIDIGFEYADSIGWDDADKLGQLSLSRILFTDSQLENGELVGWEPEDWAQWD